MPPLPVAPLLAAPDRNSKLARELYVGNVPAGMGLTAQLVKDFFVLLMQKAGLATVGAEPPVTGARLTEGTNFAFLEFRTAEDADNALAALQGVQLCGCALRIGRPKGYTGPAVAAPSAAAYPPPTFASTLGAAPHVPAAPYALPGAGAAATVVGTAAAAVAPAPATRCPDVLLVSNIPPAVAADAITAIVGAFGAVTRAQLVSAEGAATIAPADCTDPAASNRALVQFADGATVSVIVDNLDGLDMGDRKLRFAQAWTHLVEATWQDRRAPEPASAAPASPARAPAAVAEKSVAESAAESESEALELRNVLLLSDVFRAEWDAETRQQELVALKEDIADECARYGRVLHLHVPAVDSEAAAAQYQAAAEGAAPPVVPVHVLFASAADAARAREALQARVFDGRKVTAVYVPRAAFTALFPLAALPHAAAAAPSHALLAPGEVETHQGSGGPGLGLGAPVGRDDYAAEEQGGVEGGHGQHFGGVAIPPPAALAADLD
jgi:hypothetical protein